MGIILYSINCSITVNLMIYKIGSHSSCFFNYYCRLFLIDTLSIDWFLGFPQKHSASKFHRTKELIPADLKLFSPAMRGKVRQNWIPLSEYLLRCFIWNATFFLEISWTCFCYFEHFFPQIDRAIRYVDYLLEKRNLTRIPVHLYEFYNNTVSDQVS